MMGQQASDEAIVELCKYNDCVMDAYKSFKKHLEVNGIDMAKQQAVLGPRLIYDGVGEHFKGSGSKMANLFLKDSYREPFVIPAVV